MTDLYAWMRILNDELGTDVSTEVVALVLDLARDAAHNVVRPAAPVSAYLAGYAAGCARESGFDATSAADILERARLLAASTTSVPRSPDPDAARQTV